MTRLDQGGDGELKCVNCEGQLNQGDKFCARCGAPVDSAPAVRTTQDDVAEPLSPPSATVPAASDSWWTGPKVLAAVACGVVLLAVIAVAATKDTCVRRRLNIGVASYGAEMLAGASGGETQATLTERTRCPLGFAYASDLSCPIHGALTTADKVQAFKETRGIYGY